MTVAILRESLLSLSRLVPFLRQGAKDWLTNGTPARLKQLDRDLRSLTPTRRSSPPRSCICMRRHWG